MRVRTVVYRWYWKAFFLHAGLHDRTFAFSSSRGYLRARPPIADSWSCLREFRFAQLNDCTVTVCSWSFHLRTRRRIVAHSWRRAGEFALTRRSASSRVCGVIVLRATVCGRVHLVSSASVRLCMRFYIIVQSRHRPYSSPHLFRNHCAFVYFSRAFVFALVSSLPHSYCHRFAFAVACCTAFLCLRDVIVARSPSRASLYFRPFVISSTCVRLCLVTAVPNIYSHIVVRLSSHAFLC